MSFVWEALIILSVGFLLMRIAGKKTVSEMTGLEIITILTIASTTGHAVSESGLWKTAVVLCLLVSLLIVAQYLAMRFNRIEKLLVGKATVVIREGKVLTRNLKKLRMSVDQLEAKLREHGIVSFSDVKTGTIEMSGMLGYELMRHARPVTMGELEKILAQLKLPQPPPEQGQASLFDEVAQDGHDERIRPELR